MRNDSIRRCLVYGVALLSWGPMARLEPRPTKHSGRARLQPSRGVFNTRFALLPCLLAGCTRAPTFDIDGSLFPAWLVCLILGSLLAVLSRWVLSRLRVALAWPVLVYPSLAALFTFLLWLVFFN